MNLNKLNPTPHYLSPANDKHIDSKVQKNLEKKCNETERIFQFNLTTDDFPFETQWEVISNYRGEIVVSGNNYFDSRTTYEEVKCLEINQCYQFAIRDAYGDGLISNSFAGSFKVEYDGRLVLSGGGADFKYEMRSNEFGDACDSSVPSISLSSSPSGVPTSTPVITNPTLNPSLFNSPTSSDTKTYQLDWEVLIMALLFFPIAAVTCCIIVRSQISRNNNNDNNPNNNLNQTAQEDRRALVMNNVIVQHWRNSPRNLQQDDEERTDEVIQSTCNSPGRSSLSKWDDENGDLILGQMSTNNSIVSSLRSSITFLKHIGASTSIRKSTSMLNNDFCTICLEQYKENDQICRSRNRECLHNFHLDCMMNWLLRHDECPICRSVYLDKIDESYKENYYE